MLSGYQRLPALIKAIQEEIKEVKTSLEYKSGAKYTGPVSLFDIAGNLCLECLTAIQQLLIDKFQFLKKILEFTSCIFQFVDNKKSGYGVFSWPNGAKYEGEFCDNARVGSGERNFKNQPFISIY